MLSQLSESPFRRIGDGQTEFNIPPTAEVHTIGVQFSSGCVSKTTFVIEVINITDEFDLNILSGCR